MILGYNLCRISPTCQPRLLAEIHLISRETRPRCIVAWIWQFRVKQKRKGEFVVCLRAAAGSVEGLRGARGAEIFQRFHDQMRARMTSHLSISGLQLMCHRCRRPLVRVLHRVPWHLYRNKRVCESLPWFL